LWALEGGGNWSSSARKDIEVSNKIRGYSLSLPKPESLGESKMGGNYEQALEGSGVCRREKRTRFRRSRKDKGALRTPGELCPREGQQLSMISMRAERSQCHFRIWLCSRGEERGKRKEEGRDQINQTAGPKAAKDM